jgi:hypothetical protein
LVLASGFVEDAVPHSLRVGSEFRSARHPPPKRVPLPFSKTPA